jgi:hypothetical protein
MLESDLEIPPVKAVKNYVDGTVNANTTAETTASRSRRPADLNLESRYRNN